MKSFKTPVIIASILIPVGILLSAAGFNSKQVISTAIFLMIICGTLKDPFGYSWMIATHKQDLTQDEITKGAEAFFAQMAKRT